VSEDFLGDRRAALEDAFFHKEEEKKLAALKSELDRKRTRDELRSASGIADEAVLDRLVELGVTGQTVAALSLVPLLRVAWADGTVDEREREAVLQAAQGKGVEPGSAPHQLLERWLVRAPDPVLHDAWAAYVKALVGSLVPAQRELLKNQIVGFSRRVAEAAGGFLGIGKVSREEEAALAAIEAAFND
jgi:hypothetical protein